MFGSGELVDYLGQEGQGGLCYLKLSLPAGSFLHYFVLNFHTWDQCSDFTNYDRPLELDLASLGRLLNYCSLGP